MEPKVIKEEATDAAPVKENAAARCRPSASPSRHKGGGACKERARTPDSPEGARLPQHNGRSSSPPPPPSSPPPPQPCEVAKLKRFLWTLVQFGSDIGADTGDRVRALVLRLVLGAVSVEDFHRGLQDSTNFPLRPFVAPFLRTHLPLLQRELATLARGAKLPPPQYLRLHEHVVLDPALALASQQEPLEIFAHESAPNKRRASDSFYDGDDGGGAPPPPPPAKRAGGLLFSPPPHLNPVSDAYGGGDDEWRNIHVMLNCILSMVEKTKRALAILQQRGGGVADGDWSRRLGAAADNGGGSSSDIKRTAGEIMAQTIRATEDRVAEVKRRAEDAVNEVKRQAVAELQRAVAAAEQKAVELVAQERAKMEKLLLEARRQAAEEALAAASDDHNGCWNCGRKANETCSGCNTARYCGSFCQHKDWEHHHHQACCKGPAAQAQQPKTPPAK